MHLDFPLFLGSELTTQQGQLSMNGELQSKALRCQGENPAQARPVRTDCGVTMLPGLNRPAGGGTSGLVSSSRRW
jgi:hypothetical protein